MCKACGIVCLCLPTRTKALVQERGNVALAIIYYLRIVHVQIVQVGGTDELNSILFALAAACKEDSPPEINNG